jgi:uncharacterized damage-inducible protein DinB
MLSADERNSLIQRLRDFPDQLWALVADLSAEALTARPIPQEWSVAQNVHHVADSHMNAYIRFKLILLEHEPTLKPYNQDDWAETADAVSPDLEVSLGIVRGLHTRWSDLMRSVPDSQWKRKGFHPENGDVTLDGLLQSYVRHGEGHLAQIRTVLAALSG